MIRKFVIILISTLSLVGCLEKEPIEQLGIINARGIDIIEDDLIKATLVIYQFSSQTNQITRIRNGIGKTLKGATEDAEHESAFRLTPGKIKLGMFGKETAEQGILPYLDTIIRDARMADMMYLALSETTANDILTINDTPLSMDIGRYLYNLIKNDTNDHNIPRKTVRDFLRIYYDIGQDNVLPIFIIQNGMPKQKAIAVLRDDQYVGDISNKQAIYINLVNRKVKRQLFELSLPIEPFNNHLENRETHINRDIIHTTYRIENSKSKTKVIDADRLLFETDVNVTMRLLEQTAGLIVDSKHVMEILEREAEKKMTRELEQLLTQLQELNADPFGYGKYFRVKQKGGKLTREKWREKFPNIKVNFKVNVDIIRHGVVE